MTLNIKNLHAGYGAKEILCNVSIPEIKFGYFVGLIGPNASGKSNFFKTLAGLVQPIHGRITINSEDLTKLRRKDTARRIAYMPQAFDCNALLTVFKSVLLALK